MPMKTRCGKKRLFFKDTRRNVSVPLAMRYEHESFLFCFWTLKIKRNQLLAGCWANADLIIIQWNTYFEAASFGVLDRHRSTKLTTASLNLNVVHSLGASTHPRITVFTRRLMLFGGRRPGVSKKHIWPLVCRWKKYKISISLRWQKINLISVLGERRTPRAASRYLDHSSALLRSISSRLSSIFTALTPHEAGWLGSSSVEIEGIWSHELTLISVLTIYNLKKREKTIRPPEKNK